MGLGVESWYNLSLYNIQSNIVSMKASKYRGKFLERIYLHSIHNRILKIEYRTMQTLEDSREKSRRETNHSAKREVQLK